MLNIDIIFEVSKHLAYDDFINLCKAHPKIKERIWPMLERKIKKIKITLPVRYAVLKMYQIPKQFRRMYLLKIINFCLEKNSRKKEIEGEIYNFIGIVPPDSYHWRYGVTLDKKIKNRNINLMRSIIHLIKTLLKSDDESIVTPLAYDSYHRVIVHKTVQFFEGTSQKDGCTHKNVTIFCEICNSLHYKFRDEYKYKIKIVF